MIQSSNCFSIIRSVFLKLLFILPELELYEQDLLVHPQIHYLQNKNKITVLYQNNLFIINLKTFFRIRNIFIYTYKFSIV